ncbi:MAG: hypothetical protein V1746_06175, partial [bacterium]
MKKLFGYKQNLIAFIARCQNDAKKYFERCKRKWISLNWFLRRLIVGLYFRFLQKKDTCSEKIKAFFWHFSESVLTLWSLIFSGGIYVLKIPPYENSESLFLAVAAIIATMLAIVFSLRMLTVQEAAKSYGKVLKYFYRKDIKTITTFSSLGIFILFSVLLAIKYPLSPPFYIRLSCQLLILGVSMDLINAYNRHTARLLDPIYAIKLLLRETITHIQNTHKRITHLAQYQSFSLPFQGEKKQEQLENLIYSQKPE